MRQLVAVLLATAMAMAGFVFAQDSDGKGWQEGQRWVEGNREPAAVQVLAEDSVVVADLSGDEVRLYRQGGLVWTATGLDQPSGLGADADGVWVADTGNQRVLLLSGLDGAVLREIPLALPPSDVAFAAGGGLWVSVATHDLLLRLTPDGEIDLWLRELQGEELQAPRGLAPDADGGVWVAESLGGRILHVSAQGERLGVLGEWGLSEGSFLKPKDLTQLPDGGFAVVDSHQGIVQIFDAQGGFVSLVSDAEGPHLFEHPLGISWGTQGLYVADAGTAAVVLLEPGGPAAHDGHFPDREVLFRDVSVRDEEPSAVCRQCHDGTARLTAGNWDPQSNNHPLDPNDQALPGHFEVSDQGFLLCTSCHPVHTAAVVSQDGVVDFGRSVLEPHATGNSQCLECHADYLDTAGPHRRKSHPVNVDLPEDADLDALSGGRFVEGQVGCMSCHAPHGGGDQLLVLPSEDSTLCTSCHADHASGESQHPVDMELDPTARLRIVELGGVIGPGDRLGCMSCHDPHDATAGTLLRTPGAGETACGVCHGGHTGELAGGGHQDASCEGCHGMHDRPYGLGDGPRPEGVASTMCLDCHADDSANPQVHLSSMHPLGHLDDETVDCESCHEAHSSDPMLLRADQDCETCHEDQSVVAGTDHDASVVPTPDSDQTCASCHDVHGSDQDLLFAVPVDQGNPAEQRCLACHDGSTNATTVALWSHPEGMMLTVGGLPFRYGGPVPYYADDGHRTTDQEVGQIVCLTCHDPHRWKHDQVQAEGEVEGTEQNSFLRDPEEVISFCSVCHGTEGRPSFRFFHDEDYRDPEATP